MIAVDTYIEIGNTDIELIDGDRGKNYPHQNELRQEGDCVFLSANNVTTDGFKFDNVVYITAEKIEPYETEKYNVEISLLQQEARLGMLHTIISRYRMIIFE